VQLRLAIIGMLAVLAFCTAGCRSNAKRLTANELAPPASAPTVVASTDSTQTVELAAYQTDQPLAADESSTILPLPAIEPQEDSPEPIATPAAQVELSLDQVIESVRNHFPLILQAAANRRIASGQALSASGAFDHKLEAFSESQPLDFYENYRSSIGVKRDTTWGGQVFAGYRIGRGIYEPWYLERETNAGGEFKAGFIAPLIRDRWIDANRAELWQAQLERRRVEPEILAQVIRYVREGSAVYWSWVAAGANERIAAGLLELAKVRNKALAVQVEAQEKAKIDLVDNRRIIVSRESKLIDARRKLEQATVKLSLFYRSSDGEPVLLDLPLLPENYFTRVLYETETADFKSLSDDEQLALTQRPELTELQIIRQQLHIALRQAKNETWPDVDGGLLIAQDVGEPTSSLRDKSEFELEAIVTISVPLERRKALGKVRSLRGKLAQLTVKNRFAADKIVADVRIARAALEAARERVTWASENYDLAQQMQEAEQELFNQGQSTLFNLNIREQQTAEAAAGRIEAQLEYHIAKVDYAAAMGFDHPDF